MKTIGALLLASAAALAGENTGDFSRRLEAKVSLSLRGARLADALEILRNATGLNFVAEAGADMPVDLVVHDVSVRSALRLLLAPAGRTAVFEEGAVVVRTRRCLAGGTSLRIYNVRASMAKLADFPGRDLAVASGGFS
ncbi:MAG: hypothetical protein HY293_13270 [Planctomycetes bacterium]|nr:hypothetical protein [Planctomycetota bacterium]